MQTRPSLWRLTFFNVQPVWPALNQDFSLLDRLRIVSWSNAVVALNCARTSIHPLARRNINRCVHHIVSQPPVQMEQSFHRLFLEALTILWGIGVFARVTSQVGFRGSEVKCFCHPQLLGPERELQISPNHSNCYRSVDIINRERLCRCKQR